MEGALVGGPALLMKATETTYVMDETLDGDASHECNEMTIWMWVTRNLEMTRIMRRNPEIAKLTAELMLKGRAVPNLRANSAVACSSVSAGPKYQHFKTVRSNL